MYIFTIALQRQKDLSHRESYHNLVDTTPLHALWSLVLMSGSTDGIRYGLFRQVIASHAEPCRVMSMQPAGEKVQPTSRTTLLLEPSNGTRDQRPREAKHARSSVPPLIRMEAADGCRRFPKSKMVGAVASLWTDRLDAMNTSASMRRLTSITSLVFCRGASEGHCLSTGCMGPPRL